VPSGEVLELWRHPVKSMGGERLSATHIDATGVIGDRSHALFYEHKGERRRLNAGPAPDLLAWRAAYPFAPDASLKPGHTPVATVIAPDGHQHTWGDPRLLRALRAHLGRDVDFARDPGGAFQDVPQTVLLTFEASRRLLEEETGADVAARRFRSNIHIAADTEPFAELDWEGRTLEFERGVRLRLMHPCERCVIPTIDPETLDKRPELLRHLAREHATLFGIYAHVATGGRLQVGERVELV
jgi:MOSC domain-containing protein